MAFVAGGVACGPGTLGPDEIDEPVFSDEYEVFTVAGMRAQQQQQGTSFFQAMLRPSFRMGLLHGDPGQTGQLITHDDNAVYYVAAGSGTLEVEGVEHDFESGSVLFVRAAVEHRFKQVTSALDVVMVIPIAVPAASDPDFAMFTADELVAARWNGDNVFDQMLLTSTVGIGTYMLPKELLGDEVQRHQVDEFKIVIGGAGRVDLDEQGTDVAAGSVLFIGTEVGHQFRRISDDLDILVIWVR